MSGRKNLFWCPYFKLLPNFRCAAWKRTIRILQLDKILGFINIALVVPWWFWSCAGLKRKWLYLSKLNGLHGLLELKPPTKTVAHFCPPLDEHECNTFVSSEKYMLFNFEKQTEILRGLTDKNLLFSRTGTTVVWGAVSSQRLMGVSAPCSISSTSPRPVTSTWPFSRSASATGPVLARCW